jgi:hypothetical protein
MTLLGIPSTSAKSIMLLLLNNFSLILRLVGQSSALRSFVISFQEGQKVRYSLFAYIQKLYTVAVRPHHPFTSLGFAYLEFSVRFGFGLQSYVPSIFMRVLPASGFTGTKNAASIVVASLVSPG